MRQATGADSPAIENRTSAQAVDGVARGQVIPVPDAALTYWPALLPAVEAERLLAALLEQVSWTQHEVRIAGRRLPCPRLSAWYGDSNARYTYSGLHLEPSPWIPPVSAVLRAVEDAVGERFDGVLLNLYRHGRDSMGWHADDEPELGPNPVIASVSLGAERRFLLRHRYRKDLDTLVLRLEHGSLLRMAGTTQRYWRHCVPKTARPVGTRVNLTFRRIALVHE